MGVSPVRGQSLVLDTGVLCSAGVLQAEFTNRLRGWRGGSFQLRADEYRTNNDALKSMTAFACVRRALLQRLRPAVQTETMRDNRCSITLAFRFKAHLIELISLASQNDSSPALDAP